MKKNATDSTDFIASAHGPPQGTQGLMKILLHEIHGVFLFFISVNDGREGFTKHPEFCCENPGKNDINVLERNKMLFRIIGR